MAISSAGVGSGLKVDSIISQLMEVERQPVTNLQTRQTRYTNQISAMGQIKSSIAALQTAANAIGTASNSYSYKATLADTTIASASTTTSAVGGTYSVEVERLAGAHKLTSAVGADASAGGTLSIQIGSTASGSFVANSGTSPINVTINAGATLSDMASAINAAGAGVSATVINGASGAQLVVTSQSTGETNQIKISTAMSGFAFDPTAPATAGNLTQKDPGQDAILKIDGITIANTSSNTVTDAIKGVTLNLTKTNDNSPTQLVISNDSSALTTKATAFVKAYNDARTLLKNLSKYDPSGTSSGVLNGDNTISSALNQLRSALSSVPTGVSSAYPNLASLGINSQNDGSLKLDSTVLQTAMGSNFSSVATTLAAYGSAFDKLTTEMNSSEGLITAHTTGLTATSKRLGERIDDMNRNLVQVEARYRKQYTALDTLMGKLTTTSSYLTQQLAALNKSSS
jgi:flagellar hook-associated protein 2